MSERKFKNVLAVYILFTFIFFLGHGMVENILIPSRSASFSNLSNMGRGASTLSPEPAFFALHVFNLYIIFNLIFGQTVKPRKQFFVFIAVCFCLMTSLSGYGVLILFAIILVRYLWPSLISLAILFALSGFIIDFLSEYQQFRAIGLLVKVISSDPSILLSSDASIASRLGSFTAYLQSIKDNILIGDGFTLLQGGGFISLVSAMGVLAFLFLFLLFVYILNYKGMPLRFRLLLFLWFFLNFFSGPIGIPTLGFIAGLIIRHRFNYESVKLIPF